MNGYVTKFDNTYITTNQVLQQVYSLDLHLLNMFFLHYGGTLEKDIVSFKMFPTLEVLKIDMPRKTRDTPTTQQK